MDQRKRNETSIIIVNHSLTESIFIKQYNGTSLRIHTDSEIIFYAVTILVSSFGILGNGMVIWLLGFHIKRNPFITYVLNLAVADFGFLITVIMFGILDFSPQAFLVENIFFWYLLSFILLSQFSASQYLLTVISIDRCVSVFFPIWHRCHRPTKLSPIVCVLIWVISYLPSVIGLSNFYSWEGHMVIQFIVNGLLCLPLMITSSLMLFIKVCCKSKQRIGKLIITILVTVSFFCFLSLPLNIIYTICIFSNTGHIFYFAALFCACLNSSVNPLIYYLVGRPRKGRSNKSMKLVLQKLFKEEEI